MIETDRGNIKIVLFKETPLHRANFVNLVKNKYYDGQLFFRVIKEFMIQAGDPKSRGAAAKVKLGETDVSYKIPAEIDVTKRWHKYGALSAASLNPAVESSGSHFSIITGRKVNDKVLNDHEDKYNKTLRRKMYESLQKPYTDKINKLYEESKKNYKKKQELNEMIHFFTEKTDSAMAGKEFKYTPEQRKGYIEEGGAFHLDGYFTVFGQVIEGMDIVEKISRESYDVYNRPVKDVVIKRVVLLDE
jgi:peptidylprolyl isomerase